MIPCKPDGDDLTAMSAGTKKGATGWPLVYGDETVSPINEIVVRPPQRFGIAGAHDVGIGLARFLAPLRTRRKSLSVPVVVRATVARSRETVTVHLAPTGARNQLCHFGHPVK